MKYKLINSQTKEEHLCDKVTIDGFDYYVSNEKIHFGYVWNTILEQIETMFKEKTFHDDLKGVICTNNPNIDIPKVIDDIEILVNKLDTPENLDQYSFDEGFKAGYNKSQEMHQFSEEDMIEFERFCREVDYKNGYGKENRKELIQLWKKQQSKIIFYEN